MKINVHQRINLRMISLLNGYLFTGSPRLRKYIPRNLKGKARYNTCYDLARPPIPLEMINEYINGKGEKVREYLKNNLQYNNYLRVEIHESQLGFVNKFSLIKELPEDREELERTGEVRFVDAKDVEL